MESSNFEKCDVIIKGVMKTSYLGTNYQIPMIYLNYMLKLDPKGFQMRLKEEL